MTSEYGLSSPEIHLQVLTTVFWALKEMSRRQLSDIENLTRARCALQTPQLIEVTLVAQHLFGVHTCDYMLPRGTMSPDPLPAM